MKLPVVTASPGHKINLSKIDPGDTGGSTREKALQRFCDLREKISELQQILYAEHRRSLLLVFQGMDTGGKDGAIKSLCAGLNPAGLDVRSFKAPSSVELDHDFLRRAHQAAPGKGMIGIWNRSHYEDVLIVRVHKLVPKKVWKARYDQINRFEELLAENGMTIVKFMLHISKDEQEKRLQARLDRPDKWWKFNAGDIKERALWSDYQKAYEDAINNCSTKWAPWHVVPANHKWARNVALAEVVLRALKEMDPRYPKLSFDPKTIKIE
ncbi:MAG TPA: polyphosphate kinase 2 family protein [Chthoniobacterales bacterium]|nr:polyphosphate kinase 2 family protein [Chthoniobacterales bacterium]